MAMTSAERQRKYRQSKSDKRQLNTWISNEAFWALNRVSFYLGVTQKQLLEDLLLKMDKEIKASIPDDKLESYYMSDTPKHVVDALHKLFDNFKPIVTE